MSIKILATSLALGLSMAPAGACAMTRSTPNCEVIGGDKLPPETGGPSALCKAFEEAMRLAAPGLPYTAEFTVLSKSGMKASVVSDGRKIADRQISVMDRDLNPRSIENFVKALAADAIKAARS